MDDDDDDDDDDDLASSSFLTMAISLANATTVPHGKRPLLLLTSDAVMNRFQGTFIKISFASMRSVANIPGSDRKPFIVGSSSSLLLLFFLFLYRNSCLGLTKPPSLLWIHSNTPKSLGFSVVVVVVGVWQLPPETCSSSSNHNSSSRGCSGSISLSTTSISSKRKKIRKSLFGITPNDQTNHPRGGGRIASSSFSFGRGGGLVCRRFGFRKRLFNRSFSSSRSSRIVDLRPASGCFVSQKGCVNGNPSLQLLYGTVLDSTFLC